MPRHPLVIVIAGPNGAGKSTTAPRLLRQTLEVDEFVNADPIAQGLSGLRPDSVALAAGRVMLGRLRELAAARRSFAFETTLASRSFAPWLESLRASGYRVHLSFRSRTPIWQSHGWRSEYAWAATTVPEAVVRRRFVSGLRNFFALYQGIADSWQMFDNSAPGGPLPIASGRVGESPEVLEPAAWRHLVEIQG